MSANSKTFAPPLRPTPLLEILWTKSGPHVCHFTVLWTMWTKLVHISNFHGKNVQAKIMMGGLGSSPSPAPLPHPTPLWMMSSTVVHGPHSF